MIGPSIAAIAAMIAAYFAHRADRAAAAASEHAIELASEASLLASLAMARVTSSRPSRLAASNSSIYKLLGSYPSFNLGSCLRARLTVVSLRHFPQNNFDSPF